MEKIDLIVCAPHFYTMAGKGVGYRSQTAMAVDRGRIVAVEPARKILNAYTAHKIIHADHHLVLPGFIDAHMHMTDGLLRGLAQDTANWMMHGIGPFQYEIGKEGALLGCGLVVAEALAAGTTTFGEFSHGNDAFMAFMERTGVRCPMTVKIREAMDRIYEPGELYTFDPAKGERSLENCLAVHERWNGKGNGRLTIRFGPQGPDFVSRDLLRRVRELAIEKKSRIHMHVQQGDRETEQMIKRYGLRPIAFLDKMGYLDNHLMAVHLTDADESEARLAARRGASMIVCSGSIGIIDGIVPPAKAFLDGGGHVALGSDQAPGNNCHNIFNEMKLTALFNKIRYQDPEIMPAWQVLRMATVDGAKVLGMADEIGSLECGKRADFITVDLSCPSMAPVYTDPMRNMVPNLVYSARGHEVSTVAVDGKILYEDGRYTTIDIDDILTRSGEAAGQIGPRGADTFRKINGTNARFMETEKL